MIQQKIITRWNIRIYFILEKDNLKWSYTCLYGRYTYTQQGYTKLSNTKHRNACLNKK